MTSQRISLFAATVVVIAMIAIITLLGCGNTASVDTEASARADAVTSPAPDSGERAVATFAGGCFWCMEPPFDKIDGVISTISGYSGGREENPTYKQVSAGVTGHAEVVQIVYDPERVSFEKLLDTFWVNIDPLAQERQFCDRGSQYRSAIFAHDDQQLEAARQSKLRIEAKFDDSVYTEVEPFMSFYPAEDYHQDYYQKNPVRYKLYRSGCGRDRRLEQLWGE